MKGWKTPVNGYDRIKMIDWLINNRGYELDGAVREANSVESLYNENDPLFERISELGKKGFIEPRWDAGSLCCAP